MTITDYVTFQGLESQWLLTLMTFLLGSMCLIGDLVTSGGQNLHLRPWQQHLLITPFKEATHFDSACSILMHRQTTDASPPITFRQTYSLGRHTENPGLPSHWYAAWPTA